METQTVTFVQVSELAGEVMALGRRHHWRFRLLSQLQGPLTSLFFDKEEGWFYLPMRPEDKKIIPEAAFRRHAAVERAGFRTVQVIIGHEIAVAPEPPTTVSPPVPEREVFVAPQRGIDWGNVAQVAGKGLLIGLAGIAVVSFYALAGAVSMVDPSYCIVLDDGMGTVVELMRWNSEV